MKKGIVLFSVLIAFSFLLIGSSISYASNWHYEWRYPDPPTPYNDQVNRGAGFVNLNVCDWVNDGDAVKLYADLAIFKRTAYIFGMYFDIWILIDNQEPFQLYDVVKWPSWDIEVWDLQWPPSAAQCFIDYWVAPHYGLPPDSVDTIVNGGLASPTAIAYTDFDSLELDSLWASGDSVGFSMWFINGSPSGYCSKTRFHNYSWSAFAIAESSLVVATSTDILQPGYTSMFYWNGTYNTEVTLVAFDAVVDNKAITLNWQTGNEIDNLGFNVYRSESSDGEYTRINTEMVSAKGSAFIGTSYSYTDENVVPGVTYYYKLEDLDVDGFNTFHGPIMAKVSATTPTQFALGQNYPNPFNASTMISYSLKSDADVTLKIYNILGQEVKTLLEKHQPAGTYTVTWDGKDSKGNDVASGIYFYQIKAGEFSAKKKMAYLK